MYEHLASAGYQNYTTHSSIGYLQLWKPHKFVSEKTKTTGVKLVIAAQVPSHRGLAGK